MDLYDAAIAAMGHTAKYSPDQPRHPRGDPRGGQWRDAGGAAGAMATEDQEGRVVPLDKQALRDAQRGQSYEQLHANAVENQRELGMMGRDLERELGVDFIDPGPKNFKGGFDKIAREGYEGPHELLDLSRGSFVVDTPDQANAIIDRLSRSATVHDNGWKLDREWNYHDRKVYVQFPNGSASEIQIVHRQTAGVKGYDGQPSVRGVPHGAGHKLYEIARTKEPGHPVRERAARLSRRIYGRAIAGSAFAGMYTMGDISGAPIPGL